MFFSIHLFLLQPLSSSLLINSISSVHILIPPGGFRRRPTRSDPARQIGAVDLARNGALHHHLLDHLCVWHSDSVLEPHHVRLVAVLLSNAARTSETHTHLYSQTSSALLFVCRKRSHKSNRDVLCFDNSCVYRFLLPPTNTLYLRCEDETLSSSFSRCILVVHLHTHHPFTN